MKQFCLHLALALLVSQLAWVTPAYASPHRGIGFTVNDRFVEVVPAPVFRDSRLYVSLGTLGEILPVEVTQTDAQDALIITYYVQTFALALSDTFLQGHERYVPIRLIAENLGYAVDFFNGIVFLDDGTMTEMERSLRLIRDHGVRPLIGFELGDVIGAHEVVLGTAPIREDERGGSLLLENRHSDVILMIQAGEHPHFANNELRSLNMRWWSEGSTFFGIIRGYTKIDEISNIIGAPETVSVFEPEDGGFVWRYNWHTHGMAVREVDGAIVEISVGIIVHD